MSFRYEGVVGLFTSGIFSGVGSAGSGRWVDSGFASDDICSLSWDIFGVNITTNPEGTSGGIFGVGDLSDRGDTSGASFDLMSTAVVLCESSSHSNLDQFNSSSQVSRWRGELDVGEKKEFRFQEGDIYSHIGTSGSRVIAPVAFLMCSIP